MKFPTALLTPVLLSVGFGCTQADKHAIPAEPIIVPDNITYMTKKPFLLGQLQHPETQESYQKLAGLFSEDSLIVTSILPGKPGCLSQDDQINFVTLHDGTVTARITYMSRIDLWETQSDRILATDRFQVNFTDGTSVTTSHQTQAALRPGG